MTVAAMQMAEKNACALSAAGMSNVIVNSSNDPGLCGHVRRLEE
jgi:hypothetical protein